MTHPAHRPTVCPVCDHDRLVSAGCVISDGDEYTGDEFRIVAEVYDCGGCGARIRVETATGAMRVVRETAKAGRG